jgi:hypothetical protein
LSRRRRKHQAAEAAIFTQRVKDNAFHLAAEFRSTNVHRRDKDGRFAPENCAICRFGGGHKKILKKIQKKVLTFLRVPN